MTIPSRRVGLQPRPTPFRDAIKIFIVTEGARTEPEYFQALLDQRLIDARKVILRIVPPPQNASAPQHLLSALLTLFQSNECNPQLDQGWIVSDRDRWPQQNLLATIEEAKKERFGVALSRPCFEVWLRLHYPNADVSAIQSNENAEQAVRAVWSGYKKSGADYSWITRQHLQDAVDQSAAADTDPDAPIPQNVCSRVYRLMEALPMVGGRLVRAT